MYLFFFQIKILKSKLRMLTMKLKKNKKLNSSIRYLNIKIYVSNISIKFLKKKENFNEMIINKANKET